MLDAQLLAARGVRRSQQIFLCHSQTRNAWNSSICSVAHWHRATQLSFALGLFGSVKGRPGSHCTQVGRRASQPAGRPQLAACQSARQETWATLPGMEPGSTFCWACIGSRLCDLAGSLGAQRCAHGEGAPGICPTTMLSLDSSDRPCVQYLDK